MFIARFLGYFQFRLLPSDGVMLQLLTHIEQDATRRQQLFEHLKTKTREKLGQRHRAVPDVCYLIELYRACAAYQLG